MFLTDTQYGNQVPNLIINNSPVTYGVVNEREVRVVAGAMFVIGIITLFLVLLGDYRELLFVVVPLFWFEFVVKTVFGPRYSLFAFITRPLISNQTPEYVGAIQKRFAWLMGSILASIMLILVFAGFVNWIALTICITCLSLMWLESAAGICLGCVMYRRMFKNNAAVQPICAGGVCELKS